MIGTADGRKVEVREHVVPISLVSCYGCFSFYHRAEVYFYNYIAVDLSPGRKLPPRNPRWLRARPLK